MDDSPNEPELALAVWLRVLRRRWLAFTITLMVVVGAAFLYLGVRVVKYTAEAQVAVATFSDPTSTTSQFGLDGPALAEVAKSEDVAQRATSELGTRVLPKVTERGTRIVAIDVTSSDPGFAADAANTYADTLVAVRTDTVKAQLAGASEQLQERINGVDRQIAALPPVKGAEASARAIERKALEAQRGAYARALSALRVQSALALLNGERVVSRAIAPSEPSQLSAAGVVLLALVLGTVLGVGVVTMVEYADDRVRRSGRDPIGVGVRSGRPVAVLGWVRLPRSRAPRWSFPGRRRRRQPFDVIPSPPLVVAEAFRNLRTTLVAAESAGPLTVLQVTSARRSDGAAEIATQLGVAFARAGRRTIVVDLVYPSGSPLPSDDVERGAERGMAAVLRSEAKLDDVMSKVEGVDGLWLVPSGPLEDVSAADLLAGQPAQKVLRGLADRDELVVLVSPPVLGASETTVIATGVHAVLLVVRAGVTRRKDAIRAAERLAAVDAPLVGAVVAEG